MSIGALYYFIPTFFAVLLLVIAGMALFALKDDDNDTNNDKEAPRFDLALTGELVYDY